MITFKQFNESNIMTPSGPFAINSSIPHIEDLPIARFMDIMSKIDEFTITEKVDGNNLIFGYDLDGKFYTSREAKNGQRFYCSSQYPLVAANNGFRSAHVALESHLNIKHTVGRGMQVECEILHGRQPNAIVYGENHITFLRVLPGDKKVIPCPSILENLNKKCSGDVINSNPTKHIITEDGINIGNYVASTVWNLSSVCKVESHQIIQHSTQVGCDMLKELLESNHPDDSKYTILEALEIKLNKVPVSEREHLSSIRSKAEAMVKESKLDIKNTMLEKLRGYSPKLRSVPISEFEDVGIEGIVLMNPTSMEQCKIVDKEGFTTINRFNFAVRNQIKCTSHSGRTFESLLDYSGDVYGNMLREVASVTEIDDVGDYLKLKRFVSSKKGATILETIDNIIQDTPGSWNSINVIIESYIEELNSLLDIYNKSWTSFQYTLPSGKTIKYNESVHERNMIFFAEVNQELTELLESVSSVMNQTEIVGMFFAKQLKSIHPLS